MPEMLGALAGDFANVILVTRDRHVKCTVVIGHPGTGVFGGRGRRRGTEVSSRATSEARARVVKLSAHLRANQC